VSRVLQRGAVENYDARPVKIRLSTEPAPDHSYRTLASLDQTGVPSGEIADVRSLFETRWDIPTNGVLALQLLWGAHCPGGARPPSERRFASVEHMLCADLVGLDASGRLAWIFGGVPASGDRHPGATEKEPIGGTQ
jgi:hypothetical protein